MAAHRSPQVDIGREISAAFGPATLSSSSMLLFGMGRDIPDGNMTLTDDGFLDVDWRTRRSNAFFEQVRATGKDIAGVLTRSSWTTRPGT